ncbi:L,D-transpeptidase [Chondromyces apiculatus]|uniref:L,D-transpeptidase n=1 Tax=Chondromyces apiculatus TaxID=51 RepID=UPI001E4D72CF|nr:L,D-transpeptidase [Chondromyces apiculatus]
MAPSAPASTPQAEPAAAVDARPRLGAIDHFAYIYRKAAKEGLALGYIRLGTSVPLLSDEAVPGPGCPRGFYRVAPRGYACLDYRTTRDLADPTFVALNRRSPDPEAVWPYAYAFSNGAPMYSRLPTAEEQEKAEQRLGPPGSFVQLAEWSRGHEELLSTEPIPATHPFPTDIFEEHGRKVGSGLRNPKTLVWRTIPNGSMLAYAEAFEAGGRVWLLTPDLMIVPADRVRAVKRSQFKGVTLGKGLELPLAWNRTHHPRPKYRRGEGQDLVEAGTIPGKSPVAIHEARVVIGKRIFFELRNEPGVLVEEADVTVSRARAEVPRGVSPGGKWVEVKILPGTLTAYEGTRPVYATLFSPGKGGVPVPGLDHTRYATTAMGFFPIEWKERAATMSNEKYGEPKVLWFTDVPAIQYLKAPLAMHVAYWHEDFGNPKSAECVNVSALDGNWLFRWTDPTLPEGWGAMRPGGGNGPSTPVIVSAM